MPLSIDSESIPGLVVESFSKILEPFGKKVASEKQIFWSIRLPNSGTAGVLDILLSTHQEHKRDGSWGWAIEFGGVKYAATNLTAKALTSLMGQVTRVAVGEIAGIAGFEVAVGIGAIVASTVIWDQDGPEEGLRTLLSDPVKFGGDRLEDVKDIYYTTVIVGGWVVKDVRRQVFKKADVMAGVEADAKALAKEMGLSPVYDALLRNKLAGLKMGNEMAIQVVGAAAAKLHGDDVFVHEYDRRNGHVQAYMRGWPHRN